MIETTTRTNFHIGKNQKVLDARVSKLDGDKLKEEIFESVKHSQRGQLYRELPSVLIISHKQFVSLQDDLPQMHDSKERFYYTPLNVMEVEVDETLDKQQLMEDNFGEDWDGEETNDERAD